MKRKLCILLALILLLGVMGGCKKDTETQPPPASQEPSQAAASPSATGYTPETYPWHEAYLIDDPTYWSGLRMQADYFSRGAIPKALPTATKTPDQIKVGFIASQSANDFFEQLLAEAAIAGEKYGYDVSYLVADNDVDKMVRAFEDYTAQGVDVIIFDPVERDTANLAVRTAVSNGVAVIQYGIAVASEVPAITSLTGNYWGCGFEVGKYTMSQLADYPTIKAVLSVGRIGSNHRPCGFITGMIVERTRQNGNPMSMEDAMILAYNYTKQVYAEGSVDIPEADLFIASVDTTAAFRYDLSVVAAENLMTAVPDAQLYIAETDTIAIGAIRGMENLGINAGSDILVTTICDGLQEAAELIKEGKLLATGYNIPSVFIDVAFNLVKMIWEEGFDASNMPAVTPMPTVVVNKDNVDKYMNPGKPFIKGLDLLKIQTIDEQWAQFLAANPAP